MSRWLERWSWLAAEGLVGGAALVLAGLIAGTIGIAVCAVAIAAVAVAERAEQRRKLEITEAEVDYLQGVVAGLTEELLGAGQREQERVAEELRNGVLPLLPAADQDPVDVGFAAGPPAPSRQIVEEVIKAADSQAGDGMERQR